MDGKSSAVVELPANATLENLKKAYRPKLYVHRKSFKMESFGGGEQQKLVTVHGKSSLREQGLKDGDKVFFKDLGPQVSYRTVFVVEYAGPLVIMLLYAMRPSFIYGNVTRTNYGYTQKLYILLFLAHFIKREFETFFVHKFSHPTMPFKNIIRNSAYYWTFALFIGHVLCHPHYTEPSSRALVNNSAIAMVVFEFLNFAVHKQLSNMRRGDGDTSRRVPTGLLFSLVSCPNYTFEALSWAAFSLGTNILSSWIFTFVGFAQMAQWASWKHKDYIKTDPKVKRKKCIVPFIF